MVRRPARGGRRASSQRLAAALARDRAWRRAGSGEMKRRSPRILSISTGLKRVAASSTRCSAPMRASSCGAPFAILNSSARLHLSEPATVAEALTFFNSMKALHCASWERRGEPHSFAGEFFEPFHRLLIERSFAEGGIQLLRACAGERVVGYLYNFRLGNRVYAYQSGFDDADRRERPGIRHPCSGDKACLPIRARECMISWPGAIG